MDMGDLKRYRISNWEKYQHYNKGRGRPKWIKWYHQTIDHRLMDRRWEIKGMWPYLLLVASEHNGELALSSTLARRLSCDLEVIAGALEELEALGLVSSLSHPTLYNSREVYTTLEKSRELYTTLEKSSLEKNREEEREIRKDPIMSSVVNITQSTDVKHGAPDGAACFTPRTARNQDGDGNHDEAEKRRELAGSIFRPVPISALQPGHKITPAALSGRIRSSVGRKRDPYRGLSRERSKQVACQASDIILAIERGTGWPAGLWWAKGHKVGWYAPRMLGALQRIHEETQKGRAAEISDPWAYLTRLYHEDAGGSADQALIDDSRARREEGREDPNMT